MFISNYLSNLVAFLKVMVNFLRLLNLQTPSVVVGWVNNVFKIIEDLRCEAETKSRLRRESCGCHCK